MGSGSPISSRSAYAQTWAHENKNTITQQVYNVKKRRINVDRTLFRHYIASTLIRGCFDVLCKLGTTLVRRCSDVIRMLGTITDVMCILDTMTDVIRTLGRLTDAI